ncbi:hypothetical protein BDN70DRAFT_896097 [Pholiota conissans]|uniref:Uncharacterized protein n=1 Tax=Pholiota conissans TaxID=109636 RepID=A0A9P5Z0A3_9AGAR|nr:hypothetical protein BDN70DRAFT_896097 [Pholiota conissans]
MECQPEACKKPTLAIVTLATALKDIIETANAIQDAFSKRPQNYRNAQKLAISMLETLEELQEIYTENKAVIDGKKHLQRSIDNLLREIKSVHEQCTRLIPPEAEKKRDRFKIAFYSFWNRKKVEQLIYTLNEDVNACLSKFSALSIVRTETQVVEIHQTMALSHAQSEARTIEIHDTLRTAIGDGRSYRHAHGSAGTAQLFLFNESSSMPMTWVPDSIPTHLLATSYLRRELGRIDISLMSNKLRHWLHDHPDSLDVPHTTWSLASVPVSDAVTQQDAIVLVIHLQSLMREDPSESWMHSVHFTLAKLIVKLTTLRMTQETLLINNQLVDFWRDITRHHRSKAFVAHFVTVLTQFAKKLSDLEDQHRACFIAAEAIQVNQSLLQENDGDMQSKMRCMESLAFNMLIQANWESDRNRAIHLIEDVNKILETAFGHDDEDLPGCHFLELSHREWPQLNNSDNATVLPIPSISDDYLYSYASILFSVAEIQLAHHKKTESHKSAKTALQILNHLRAKYHNSNRIQRKFMQILIHLSNQDMRPRNTDAENQEFTEKSTAVLWELAKTNPQRYVLRLTDALWIQREVLLGLGRRDESQKRYLEMVNLGRLAAMPPHFDIKIPSKIEGFYYYKIALYHYNTNNFTDAVFAAQNAASQYSAVLELSLSDLGHCRRQRIRALTLLCKSLTAAGQYDLAVSEGFKTLDFVSKSNLYSSESNTLEFSENILQTVMGVLATKISWDPNVHPPEDINARIQRLSRSKEAKSQRKLAWASIFYAYLLQRNGMVEKALLYCHELCDNWSQKFGDSFNASGRIDILCYSGRHPEAMELSEKVVADVRQREPLPDNHVEGALNSFSIHCSIQLMNHAPQAALETAKEALLLCQRMKSEKELLLNCFLDLSDAYADIGNVDDAITCLDEAESMIHDTPFSLEMQKYAFRIFPLRRSTLLFAKGFYENSAALIQKVVDIDRKNAETNENALKELMDTLLYSGIVFCTSGRHEDGLATAKELFALREELEATSPVHARLIATEFDNLVRRGWWKPVRDAKEKLTCGHQDIHKIR